MDQSYNPFPTKNFVSFFIPLTPTLSESPMLCVSRSNKCMILAAENKAYFLDEKTGLKTQLTFRFDPVRLIVTILI
jgi:hypothetical protein